VFFLCVLFFFSSRRRHTRFSRDWSSDVCSSDLGVANVDVYPAANVAMPFNNGAGVTYDWARESWTPDHPNAKLPLLTTFTDANENFINSTFWLRDASYLRMKNISLTYNVSDRWLKTWGGSKLAVYISGQNLWTISKFKMWDPE